MRKPLTPDRLMAGLEAIAATVSLRPEALALLALGSCGIDHARLDGQSDLDFFVIVQAHAKDAWVSNLDWLTTGSPLAFAHRNTADGWKTLDEDGVLCEFAVFYPEELANIPFSTGRTVWAREGFDTSCLGPQFPARLDDVAWLAVEAATNILVGLKRFLRGEVLAARRAICGDAADQVCALRLHNNKADPYNSWRRLEVHNPALGHQMAQALAAGDPSHVARALMALISENNFIPEALVGEINDHLEQCNAR